MRLVALALLVAAVQLATAVDESNFKDCDEIGFCKRQRGMEPTGVRVVSGSLDVVPALGQVRGEIEDGDGNLYEFTVFAGESATSRLRVVEKEPVMERYEPRDALIDDIHATPVTVVKETSSQTEVSYACSSGTTGSCYIKVFSAPFMVEWGIDGHSVVRANEKSMFHFERTRAERPSGDELKAEKDEGMWEERWKGKEDSKRNGPQSIGMDLTFTNTEFVYGLPEHADTFNLRTTTNSGDPYRLYNLDVFEYDLDSVMALYGAIPFIIGHSEEGSAGVFWLNAAETWVDVDRPGDGSTNTHWMSETGVIDVYVFMGPTPKNVFAQYAALTGPTQLPQKFAIMYHQCRWNYKDEEDVRNVDATFDENDIPYDVIWLDIEHTDSKKYFTWDKAKFPHPEEMQAGLAAKGRKLVNIVDPHIKRDNNYFLHKESEDNGYYVKNKDGNDYEGACWPGSSSWLDVTAPRVREFVADQYDLEKYRGSTENLYVWNDMNEPSVFSGPEITMDKDAVHDGGWEHRDVHNIFGMYYHMATFMGLEKRGNNNDRPFVLTRAFFAGTQRYGAVWTGDNKAEWDHLAASIPMLLSHGVAGQAFIGADVGGFFGNPSTELLTRWYQVGALQPFFRAHAHIDTRRREPWLFGDRTTDIVRTSVRRRYALMPYIYTLFEEASRVNTPVMRPFFVEFPTESKAFAIEDAFLLGPALLVHPVVDEGVNSVSVYFPGTEPWYDVETGLTYAGGSKETVNAPLDVIPVFQRGGTVVPKKERARRSSAAMAADPYTLRVALDSQGKASGELYLDDGHSYAYKSGTFHRRLFSFADGVLTSSTAPDSGSYTTTETIERIAVKGLSGPPASVTLQPEGRELEFSYNDREGLVIRKPDVLITSDFSVVLG